MRGRLIFPFVLEFAQLDTAATAADPDGPASLESGYDDDFREPALVANGTVAGVVNRKEKLLTVRAQIEPKEFEVLNALASGNSPDSKFTVILHRKELERASLIDNEGNPRIYVGDRLSRIFTTKGKLVQTIQDPPGMYIIEMQPRAFGLGNDLNLYLIRLWDRKTTGRGIGETAS